ncbi:MAG TPA: UPF0182 family protein, partial [Armatimonadetes bacterium]|nr:UPF0182 family protein [Armatimonadota bacterium]
AASVVAGLYVSSRWRIWLQFLHASPFGVEDPIFHHDIGFYVFRWPFWQTALQGLSAALVLVVLFVALLYFYEEGIQISEEELFIATQAKNHLLGLGAAFLVLRGGLYWLKRYEILYSSRGVVFGAGYTDVHANLPVYTLLAVLCIIAAGLCLRSWGERSPRPALYGLGAVLLVAVVGGNVYPKLLQQFLVAPNEIDKEKQYIEYNIAFTRRAYGLDQIQEHDFAAEEALEANDLQRNAVTIRNIRLWDHRPLRSTYEQMQEIRPYYEFHGVDIDRYRIQGELYQVMLSARELDHNQLPEQAKRWVNEHVVYTHGYGICMSPANRVENGLPAWFIKDIPPVSPVGLQVERPEIYFGEVVKRPRSPEVVSPFTGPATPRQRRRAEVEMRRQEELEAELEDYLLVHTAEPEFDYPQGTQNVKTRYQGRGGVPVGSFWRRILFALRFRDAKIFLTQFVTPQSRIIFRRQIRRRVETIAPFLTYDDDPYIVLAEGRLYWIIDAYTITRRYPYSEPELRTPHRMFNYIRNAVKVVVDAYHGTTTFYLVDETDPLAKTYSRIFPSLFKPFAAMPPELRAHIRYPQDLFEFQAAMYTIYHMTDPTTFYNKEDQWTIARERSQEGQGQDQWQLMRPYYIIMRLPGEPEEEFILILPFTPRNKRNMIAWMCAKCDPEDYGRIIVFGFPKRKLVYGPEQIEARIDQDPDISRQLTLWSQRGSEVFRGNLLVIPIEESLLYVEPLYLRAEASPLPELKRVIVVYGKRVVMEPTLERALERIFGRPTEAPPEEVAPPPEVPPPTPPEVSPPVERQPEALIAEAVQTFEESQAALQEGDWRRYGEVVKQLEQTLRELESRMRRPKESTD